MRAPEFWAHRSPIACALWPLGVAYGLGARLRQAMAHPPAVSVPVICVGNLTVGGGGKTPTALALAPILRSLGLVPHYLTRGYGGRLTGPVRVDPAAHGAAEVGDEPLLLAADGPCWVARDRLAGAQAAVAAGATAVLMDDGLQNVRLRKTLSLAVIDGAAGLGNGFVLPAGPLRERAADGLARVRALVVVEPVAAEVAATLGRLAGALPQLRARFVPNAAAQALAGRRVLAFAGIARPEKFFATLRALGCEVVETAAFGDHHPYRAGEIAGLRRRAEAAAAVLATTAKDHVRLPTGEHEGVVRVDGRLAFADEAAVAELIAGGIGLG